MGAHWLVVAVAVLLGAKENGPDQSKQDVRLPTPSVWELVRVEEQGERDKMEGQLELRDNAEGRIEIKGWGQFDLCYRLHRSNRRIDLRFRGQGGFGLSPSIPCLYRCEGDRLMLCLPREGNERPTGFVTRPDDKRLLFVFKRKK